MVAIQVLGVLVVTLGGVLYLWRYREEGIAALYFNGTWLFFLLGDLAGVLIPTLVTGLFQVTTGTLAMCLWLRARPREQGLELPRTVSFAWAAMFLLALFWLTHHLLERSAYSLLIHREYYKWAFAFVRWMLPLSMGLLFPLSAHRIQRFLRAVGILGLVTAGFVIVAYFSGLASVSGTGSRYMFTEKVGETYAAAASIGIGAVLGGYLVAQGRLTVRRLVFVLSSLLVLFTAAVLSGTRSTVLFAFMVTLVALGFFRIRYMLFAAAGFAAAAGLVFFVIAPTLPTGVVGRALSWEMIMRGANQRLYMAKQSLKILEESPAIGRTLGLQDVIDAPFSHNFTLQVLVETGLLGWGLYLAGFAMIVVKLCRMIARKGTALFQIGAPLFVLAFMNFLEAHAHASLMNLQMWMILGLIAGHSIRGWEHPYIEEEWQDESEAAWLPEIQRA